MQMLAIDLAKQSFHVHGINSDGEIISRRVGRQGLPALVEKLDPEVVAMEACATAHYWGRRFIDEGRQVRLINPHFVKPFVRGSKNDAVDAEAIFDAASRPTMRFVPVKTEAQQDLQSLHRVRDRLVAQRTSLINHLRGLLAEYGLIFPKGAALLLPRVRAGLGEAQLSKMAHETFEALVAELEMVEERIDRLDKRLDDICREDAICRRLMTLPGVGPIVATALAASIGDPRQFQSGREMAAWIGLVPRQYSTGGKTHLGGVGRRANHYLRRQLVHGARAVALRLKAKTDARSLWFQAVIDRRGFNKGIVAMANKTVRIAWAMLIRQEDYARA
ncbi:IS110 family transposase [Sphingomonas lycopersici]|uniref:IS110 family transposase n=1 Tax=Sphingomonas lycopersici TaxID=2951807 RepID=A0AA41ZAI8_9SPHN|nr:IS110 family transposase [Sphingomonas lycopersici]MCW6536003.1 IS110 family transposase [Sphingomonas lycopersici]